METYFQERSDAGGTAQGTSYSNLNYKVRTAGSGESTGLDMKRNPTVRLDTVITLFMPAQVSVFISWL